MNPRYFSFRSSSVRHYGQRLSNISTDETEATSISADSRRKHLAYKSLGVGMRIRQKGTNDSASAHFALWQWAVLLEISQDGDTALFSDA